MLNNIIFKQATRYTAESGKPVVYNYRKYAPPYVRKKALLSYITQPFFAEKDNERIVRFSNSGLGLSWARVLNELGYAVDIIDWDNDRFVPKDEYDLIVFHGAKNFHSIFPRLSGPPKIIHFLTGSYWKFNNKAEDLRIADFRMRYGIYVERDRYIYADEDPVNKAANGIIVLGDPSMRDTYPKHYRNVITINNASYQDNHFDNAHKKYSEAKENFLFFAGSGNIHKGLDLLIDSFKDLEQNLYIVTVPDKKVMAVFKNELQLPNIHLVGEVNMRTPEFYNVMDKCAFVILPSCSEGQAGSVVEAMNQGLIPIVSKETRLDARDYGAVLENNKIETIQKTVQRMSALGPTEVEKMSKNVRRIAMKEHNPEKFRKDLKIVVKKIIENTDS